MTFIPLSNLTLIVMKKYAIFFLAIPCMLVAGCSSHRMTRSSKLKPSKLKNNTHYIVPTDASLRSSIIWTDDTGNFHYLSEVSPDAMVTAVTNLTNSLSGKALDKADINGSQITQITQSVTELGKRTVAVSILRDALYRLEEYNMNDKVRQELKDTLSATYKLFRMTLEVAQTIAQSELEAENAKKAEVSVKEKEVENETIKLKIQENLTQNATANSTKYENASRLETQGFEYLLNDDVDKALQSFKDAESIYPSFHNTYEIGKLLFSKKDSYSNKSIQIEVLEKILKDYSWGMPPNISKQLTNKIQSLKK